MANMTYNFENEDSEAFQIARVHFLEGSKRVDIARKFGVAEGKVSAIVSEFDRQVAKGKFNETRAFVVAARKLGHSVSSLVPGARIVSVAERLGLRPDGVESFLEALAPYLKGKVNKEQLAKAVVSIIELSKNSDMPLEEISARLQRESDTYKIIKSQIVQANDEKAAAEQRTRDAIEGSNLKVEAIQEYLILKTNLAALGLDWNDLDDLKTMLLNWKDCKFSQMEIVDKLTQIGTLRHQIENLLTELAARREELSLMYTKVDYAKQELGAVETMTMGLRRLHQDLLEFAREFKQELSTTAGNMSVSSTSLHHDCISVHAAIEVLATRRTEWENEYRRKVNTLDAQLAILGETRQIMEWLLGSRPLDPEVAASFLAVFDKWGEDSRKLTGANRVDPRILHYRMYLVNEVRAIFRKENMSSRSQSCWAGRRQG